MEDYKTKRIRELAGTISVIEIAQIMGITKKSVENIAYKSDISLATGVQRQKREEHELKKERRISAASDLLRANGYTVMLPCPFRSYVDAR
jgi:hypothetical protein